jgi:hypothetical protein
LTAPYVLLAFPTYNNPHPGAARSVWYSQSQHLKVQVYENHRASLLACGFNMAWCRALNLRKEGLGYFAMLHADIEPEPWWVDLLYAEMEKFGLDVISAVVPIKDQRGLTSTGIGTADAFQIQRRLTMHEVYDLPVTFTASDIPQCRGPLVVNTGCMLVRMRPDSQLAHFEIRDRILQQNGEWYPLTCPEDWGFSLRAHALGWRVGATRAVRLAHHGDNEYTNIGPWGSCLVDPDALTV